MVQSFFYGHLVTFKNFESVVVPYTTVFFSGQSEILVIPVHFELFALESDWVCIKDGAESQGAMGATYTRFIDSCSVRCSIISVIDINLGKIVVAVAYELNLHPPVTQIFVEVME